MTEKKAKYKREQRIITTTWIDDYTEPKVETEIEIITMYDDGSYDREKNSALQVPSD